MLGLAASGCGGPGAVRESVMPTGTTLMGTANGKTIEITAVSADARRYVWNGREAVVHLDHRQRRFYGILGLFSANALLPGWNRIFRATLDEAQLHFEDEKAMELYVRRPRFAPYGFVWTRTGLLLSFGEIPARNALNVSVYQVCVRGEKPARLPGASDDAIRLRGANGRPAATLPCTNPGPVNLNGP